MTTTIERFNAGLAIGNLSAFSENDHIMEMKDMHILGKPYKQIQSISRTVRCKGRN